MHTFCHYTWLTTKDIHLKDFDINRAIAKNIKWLCLGTLPDCQVLWVDTCNSPRSELNRRMDWNWAIYWKGNHSKTSQFKTASWFQILAGYFYHYQPSTVPSSMSGTLKSFMDKALQPWCSIKIKPSLTEVNVFHGDSSLKSDSCLAEMVCVPFHCFYFSVQSTAVDFLVVSYLSPN